MVRLFNVYYPVRGLLLLGGEVFLIAASFLLAAIIRFGPDSSLVLYYENGMVKILGVTALGIICLYYSDLYDLASLRAREETYFRLLSVIGLLAIVLATIGYFFPHFMLGRGVFVLGITFLTVSMLAWRAIYSWLIQQPALRERVYILGAGERAGRLVESLRSRPELGMEVVGWAGAGGNGSLTRDTLAATLAALREKQSVERVIVALPDRRGTMPVRELLDLRLSDVKVEEASELLEKISGKIGVDDLNPSSLVFAEGFRLNPTRLMFRRLVSIVVSLVCLVILLPLIPFIVLAIKLTSRGPVLYRQARVGRNGVIFNCYKFRTMWADAEADTGPTWASDEDPRITPVGRILRLTRLDELPQFWNVLRGDMGFVGPRPERPEFVEWLTREIPYYQLRHIIRPGVTGWAQISYRYGASLEEAKEKLQYDLYYIKNISLALDLYIMFRTVKTVLFGQGAK